jgi:hypothetical protein
MGSAPQAFGREQLSQFPSANEMNDTIDADRPAAAAHEGEVAYIIYFTNREPIEGTLTLIDLTKGSCRWPSGNPRDLKTFRYCGDAAHDGPYCERHARLAYLSRAA